MEGCGVLSCLNILLRRLRGITIRLCAQVGLQLIFELSILKVG
jgi:hypothetical protein